MSDNRTAITAIRSKSIQVSYEEIRTELFRKSIHIMVALVPAIAAINISVTELLLASAVILYSFAEVSRLNGRPVAVISGITSAAARKRDSRGFILGPVTLAIGAMLALLLYPSVAAAVAIYALAFGDSIASLVGKLFGRISLPGFRGKTVEGAIACVIAVFISTFAVTSKPVASLCIALAAAIFELMPVKDLDNLIIPVGTGLVAVLVI